MSGPAGKRNGMWRQGWKIAGKRNGMRRKPDSRPRGERNGAAVLCEKWVRGIRKDYKAGLSLTVIAGLFSVSESTIRRAVKRQTWGHVR